MARKCFDAIKKALGDDADEKQVNSILNDMDAMYDSAVASDGDVRNFRKMALDYLKNNRILSNSQRIANVQSIRANTQARTIIDTYLDKFGPKNAHESLLAIMTGSLANFEGGRNSAFLTSTRLRNTWMQTLISGLEADGTLKLIKDGSMNKEIMQELYEIRPGGQPGVSGNKYALKAANTINGVQRMMLKEMQDTGIPVRDYQGRIMQQTHDPALIRAAGFEDWARKITPQLDHSKTFGIDQSMEAKVATLKGAYDDITIGRTQSAEGGDLLGDYEYVNRKAMLGGQATKSRSLHFKSGEDFYNYNQEFSKKDLLDSISSEINRTARNVGIISKFGVDPDSSFQSHKNYIAKRLNEMGDEKAITNFASQSRDNGFLDQVYAHMKGIPDIPGTSMMARSASGLRSVSRMATLGSVALSHITFLSANAANISSVTGKNFLQAHLEFATDWLKSAGSPERQRLFADKLGLSKEIQIAETSRMLDGNNDVPGALSKLERGFFKASLLPWQSQLNRITAGHIFSTQLADSLRTGFDNLHPRMKANLEAYNITKNDWKMLQENDATEMIYNRAHMTNDSVMENTGNKKLADKISNYITDNANAVGNPDLRTKAQLIHATSADDWTGQFWRMTSMLKSFPITQQHMMTKMVLSDPSIHSDSFMQAMNPVNNLSGIKTMAQYAASATATGYLAVAMHSLAKGEAPPNPLDPKTFTEAMLRSGAGGMIGDTVHGMMYDKDIATGAAKLLAGPVLSQAWPIGNMVSNAIKSKPIGPAVTDFALKQIPGNNLFWSKAAINYLVLDEIRNAVDPGFYVKKQIRDMKNSQGQQRVGR